MENEKLTEYVVEHGTVFIPIKGSKKMKQFSPGSHIRLPPRVAARLLLNKGKAAIVADAERLANDEAAKATAEAEADLKAATEAPIIDQDVASGQLARDSAARGRKSA